jgi:HSP20 family protein
MTLVRWKPAQELTQFPTDILSIQRSINKMFESFFHGGTWDEELTPSLWTPAVDIAEKDDEFIIKVELPGVDKKDVRITTQNNVLTVRGEKKQEKETREASFHRVERSYGSFQRSFPLPGTIVGEKIQASYKDGILEVVVPKAEEAKARTIEVNVK